MADNLKHIVEEGFARLSTFTEQRKGIIGRFEAFFAASTSHNEGDQIDSVHKIFENETKQDVVDKLNEVSSIGNEVTDKQTKSLTAYYNQFLAEVDTLQAMHECSQSRILQEAHTNISMLLMRTEEQLKKDGQDLLAETERMLSEADHKVRRGLASASTIQTDCRLKLATLEQELQENLHSTFALLVQEALKKMAQTRETIEECLCVGLAQINESSSSVEDKICSLRDDYKELLQSSFLENEKAILRCYDEKLAESICDMQDQDDAIAAALKMCSTDLQKDLTEKFVKLQENSNALLENEHSSRRQLHVSMLEDAERKFEELVNCEASDKIRISYIAESCEELQNDLDQLYALRRQTLHDLLSQQTERIQIMTAMALEDLHTTSGEMKEDFLQYLESQELPLIALEASCKKHSSDLNKEIQQTQAALSAFTAEGT